MSTHEIGEDLRDPAREREAESWLRARVVELEGTLTAMRRRQIAALADDGARAEETGPGPVFRDVLQRLPSPLLVLAEDDVVLFANAAAARFFGTSFNVPGGRTLAQCIGTGSATRLSALRPGEADDHGWIEALDGSGAVRCHAFLARVDDCAVRCVQIDWNPGGRELSST